MALLRDIAAELAQPLNASALAVLRDVFGYDSFRPGQAEIIEALLAGRDCVGVMPTGAGKSITYQIPARVLGGTTLVISPLVALMKDQVDAMGEVGLRATYLANCPFQDQKFDTIINILSPANYAEFIRLLKPDGVFIKVVPESGYLKELREIFYDATKQQSDSDPLNRFEEHFKAVTTERITYQFPLPNGLLAPLIRMTPLSWGASAEKIEEALSMEIPSITIDYTVISGLKN